MTPRLLVLATASAIPVVTDVTPLRFPREVATALTVTGEGFVTSGLRPGDALCAIRGRSGAFYSADLETYRPMKAVNATVLDARTLTCETSPTQNAGPASVAVSFDAGANWSDCDDARTPSLEVFAAVEVAIGRRPYTTERAGAVLVKPDAALYPEGSALEVDVSLAPRRAVAAAHDALAARAPLVVARAYARARPRRAASSRCRSSSPDCPRGSKRTRR